MPELIDDCDLVVQKPGGIHADAHPELPAQTESARVAFHAPVAGFADHGSGSGSGGGGVVVRGRAPFRELRFAGRDVDVVLDVLHALASTAIADTSALML